MNKLNVIVCFLMILSFSSVAMCAEGPAYSLGTMQPIKTYISSPGKNVTLTFYIFNAYGNRISHITLYVSDNPDNLEVILPPLQHNRYNISGISTVIDEQLYVCNMSIVEVKPDPVPTDNFCYKEPTYYLKSTNVSGFIPAKRVEVMVKMPEDAKLGTQYALTIMANANWYGEMGTSQVSQARPFTYNIAMVSENYSETLLPPEGETEGGGGWSLGLSNETVFGIVIAVLVIVILFQQFRPKKHR